jgi:O-antigen ligase
MTFFKPPYEYSEAESRVLSGRPLIWSGYIYAWMNGHGLQHLFGFGPDSWTKSFKVYAHNTLVNTLYETGLAGVLAVLFTWLTMLAAALRVRHPNKGRLLAAHITFLLLNMGTMPMWMIEGNVLYGVICGYTLYLLTAPQTQAARAPVRPRPAARPVPSGPPDGTSRPAA